MTMFSKYPGKCRKCNQKFPEGTEINWEPGSGAAHVNCPETKTVEFQPDEVIQLKAESYEPKVVLGTVPEKGTYTVELGESHRTIRFKTPKYGAFAGKTIVQYLAGPNNDSDYIAFGSVADVDADGKPVGIRIWRKFEDSIELYAALSLLLSDLSVQFEAGERYALESSNCFRCGKTLTVPISIYRGLGPECAKKAWGL